MRRLFSKFRRSKTKWIFQKSDLTESTNEIRNPARGWYRIYTFMAEDKPNFKAVGCCMGDSMDTLALVIINIGAYRDEEIDENGIKNIRDILRFFTLNQMDMILRITYDHEGRAFEREPFFFEQVKSHVKQLVPILKEFSTYIFIFQGLLIGNWGEMHTSRFLAPGKLNILWNLFKDELEQDIYFAVRKPAQWRILHPREEKKDMFVDKHMGLFDDAMFGSESHLGTFSMDSAKDVPWDALWCREDELAFEDKLCVYVPNGGEALCGEQYLHEGALNETIAVLKKMHITYLNRQYDKLILNTWKEWIWEGPGVWQGQSVYDYIGSHLGYRFRINDVSVTESKKINNEMDVAIQIENVGFANLYQEAELHLICEDEQEHQYERKLDVDMRTWNSMSVHTVTTHIRKLNCRIYLTAIQKYDGRRIYFANEHGKNGRVLLGSISNPEDTVCNRK